RTIRPAADPRTTAPRAVPRAAPRTVRPVVDPREEVRPRGPVPRGVIHMVPRSPTPMTAGTRACGTGCPAARPSASAAEAPPRHAPATWGSHTLIVTGAPAATCRAVTSP